MVPDFSSCPEPRDLSRMLNADLTDNRWSDLVAHVENCDRCQAILDGLTEDPDISHSEAETASREPELAELIAVLHEQPEQGMPDMDGSPPMTGLPERIDQFRILGQRGIGATGKLFEALDLDLDRIVALKVLRPELVDQAEYRERFEREARAAAKLRHPSIATVFAVCNRPPNPPYLVMELVRDGSLADRFRMPNKLTLEESAEICQKIASALQMAHDHGIIHRDVKPSNILLDFHTLEPRLTDFGLARHTSDPEGLTQIGIIAGTPAYMSPEQIDQVRTVDGRTDIYSLGIVLYQLLTLSAPFRGSAQNVLRQVVEEDPLPLRELDASIPVELEIICLKSIDKDPDRRYQSAREMSEDLKAWLNGEAIQARPSSRWHRIRRKIGRHPTLLATSLVAILSLAIGLGFWLRFTLSLDHAVQRANEAELRATQNASVAREQRDLAVDTLKSLVFDLAAKLDDPNTELDDLQRQMYQTARDGLMKMSHSAATNGILEFSTGVAELRIGELTLNLGDTDAALANFSTARTIFENLPPESATETERLNLLAQTLVNIAEATDDDELSYGLLEEANVSLQDLVRSDQANVETMMIRCDIELALGDADWDAKRLESARQHYVRIDELSTGFRALDALTEFQREELDLVRILAFSQLADLEIEADQYDRALGMLEQGLSVIDESEGLNRNAAPASLKGLLLLQATEAHRWQGHLLKSRKSAVSYSDHANAISRVLTTLGFAVRQKLEAASLFARISHLNGDTHEAIQHLDGAIRDGEAWLVNVQDASDSYLVMGQLISSLLLLSDWHIQNVDNDAALTAVRNALNLLNHDEIPDIPPSDSHRWRSLCWAKLAWLAQQRNSKTERDEAWNQLRALETRIPERSLSDSASANQETAQLWILAGDVADSLEEPSIAFSYWEKAIQLLDGEPTGWQQRIDILPTRIQLLERLFEATNDASWTERLAIDQQRFEDLLNSGRKELSEQ